MYEANVLGTEHVLRAVLDAGTPKVVYVSTVGAFGNTHGEVVDESYEHPGKEFTSYYEQTKYEAHQIAKRLIAEEGLPCVIVQPGGVYGPDDHSAIGSQINQFLDGKMPLMAFPDLGMNMVHVDDVAAGILLALDKGKPGEAYVLGGEITTMREMIATVGRVADTKPPTRSFPTPLLKALTPVGPLVGKVMDQRPNLRELISVRRRGHVLGQARQGDRRARVLAAWSRGGNARDPRGRGQAGGLSSRSASGASRLRARRVRHHRRRGDHRREREPACEALEDPGADRIPEDDDAAEDRGAVRGHRRGRDHGDRLAELHATGEREEGAETAGDRERGPGAEQGDRAPPPIDSVSALIATLETPISTRRRARERRRGRSSPCAAPLRRTGSRRSRSRSSRRRPGSRSSNRRSPACGTVTARNASPVAASPSPSHCAAAEAVVEIALRRKRDQHQPAGDHGLDERQRRDRHRGDVEHPGDGGDREAHGPPARAEQCPGAAIRAPQRDLRRLARPAVLAEHREVRHRRAGECERYAKRGHRLSGSVSISSALASPPRPRRSPRGALRMNKC